jgi:hypothetical protein
MHYSLFEIKKWRLLYKDVQHFLLFIYEIMLDKIIYFSIKNKLIIGIFTLGLVLWGVWSATQLPIDAVPDITNNQVQVITTSLLLRKK